MFNYTNTRVLHKTIALLLVSGVCLAFANQSDIQIQKRQKKVSQGYSKLKQKSIDLGMVRVIAKLKKKRSSKSQTGTLKSTLSSLHSKGLKEKRVFDRFNASLYELTPKQLDKLLDDSNVEYIQEDTQSKLTLNTSIPQIGANYTQSLGREGNGQIVVVFDSGIETDHPFIGGRVIDEACFSTENTGNYTTSGDPYSFKTTCPNNKTRQYGTGAGVPCADLNGGNTCSHGTHVAGIATGGSSSMNGVAPASDIIAVQVMTYNENISGDECDVDELTCYRSFISDQLDAMLWVLNHEQIDKIAAINMSLGGGAYASHCDDDVRKGAIDQLKAHGVATVISSGNAELTNETGKPGCISSAITVGSVDNGTTDISWFSNRSLMVDVVAPGNSIYSSIIGYGYESWFGTSMSAPHVAGAVAILKSQDFTLSVDEITDILKETGTPTQDDKTLFTTPMIRLDLASVQVQNNLPTLATPAMTGSYSPRYNSATTNSTYSSSYSAWRAFDQSPTWSNWISGRFKNENYERTANIMFSSRGQKKVVSYELVGRPDYHQKRLPKNWKLQGSNSTSARVDDSIYNYGWRTIDTRTNITIGDEWQITNNRNRVSFAIKDPTYYHSYRLCISQVNGSDVVDLIEIHLND